MAVQTSSRSITRQSALPPLILHPFSDASGPGRLVESSRASLMLQGLLPAGELSVEELERRLLDGRFCELRMLFYVGRDVGRWIDQCLEYATSHPVLRERNCRFQTFAALLIDSTPPRVAAKLKQWGVADYRAIFQRAIGLNCLLAEVPSRDFLADEFVRNYYRYADNLYLSRLHATAFDDLPAGQFEFELFASGEYTRMLERQWEDQEAPGE